MKVKRNVAAAKLGRACVALLMLSLVAAGAAASDVASQLSATRDRDPAVRIKAVEALAAHQTRDVAVRLAELARTDPDASVRVKVCSLLAKVRPLATKEVDEALVECLDNDSLDVRRAAFEAIASFLSPKDGHLLGPVTRATSVERDHQLMGTMLHFLNLQHSQRHDAAIRREIQQEYMLDVSEKAEANEATIEDDFSTYPSDSDGSPRWATQAGKWRMADGIYQQDDPFRPKLITFSAGPAMADMSYSVRFRIEPGSQEGDAGAGMVLRAIDSVHYYYVAFKQWGQLRIARCMQGRVEVTLLKKDLPIGAGKWHTALLECNGSRIRVSLDGKPVGEADSSTFTVGRVGLMADRGKVQFDNVAVKGRRYELKRPWTLQEQGHFETLRNPVTEPSGKLDISVGKPFIISTPIARPQLGLHLFPHVFKLLGGDLFLVFHAEGDIHGATRVFMRSRDKGKTWTVEPQRVNRCEAVGALKDGTVLVYDCYGFKKAEGLFAREMFRSTDGGRTFEGPLLAMVSMPPDKMEGGAPKPRLAARYRKTSAQWGDRGHGPFWRTVLELDDGSLLACGHTRFKDTRAMRDVCYKSTDKGTTWHYLSTIMYDPDFPPCPWEGEVGFHEPVMSRCADGSILCVTRTHSFWPLMQARSRDNGKTWDAPVKAGGELGVDPDLCLMTGGVLACTYGRPGVRVMFSADGTGLKWTDRIVVFGDCWFNSTCYTGIVEVEPGKLLLVYDVQDYFPELGKQTRAVLGRYITVRTN